jgi:ribose transport system substrate-binding protein
MAGVGLAGLGCPKEQPAPPTAPGPSGGGSGAPAAGAHLKIAVMPKGTAASFWQSVKAGAEAAGKEDGAEIIWQGPASEGDITQQIDLVNNQVTSKVDGIVIAATDATALVKPLQDAKSKGIPIVTVDSGVSDPSVAESYIATDNVEGGRRAADALAKMIGEKGKVGLMIFQKGAKSSDDRQQGFEEGIKKYPNIKLVSTLEANDPQKCTDSATNMLTANPDIAGIFAANEPNGIGAGNVLRQKNLIGKVKLVAYDSSPDELTALKDGVIEALIVQDPFQMGYKGVKTVIKAIHKEPVTDKFINSGMTVVTKENLDTPEVKKLLGP